MRAVKVWSSAVFAVMLMAAVAFGQDNLKVTSASGAPGSEVRVEINATSASAISAVEVKLTFDKNVLQLKSLADNGITKGDATTAWSFALLGDAEITAANSSGTITISLVDFGQNTVAAGSNINLIDLTFTIAASAAAGSIPVEIETASMSSDQAQELSPTATNGAVTVTTLAAGANSVWVADANGAVNGTSTMHVKATSDKDIYAAQFDVLFDQTVLQIPASGVTLGNDAKALELPAMDADVLAAANSSGKLVVYMIDLNSDPATSLGKITAGEARDLLAVKFQVSSSASEGEQTISLANVSLVNVVQDTVTTEIAIETVTAGKLTIGQFAPGDVSGDGKVNIFDLLDLLKAMKGQSTAGPSDVNGDGKVNIFDLLDLLKLMKGN